MEGSAELMLWVVAMGSEVETRTKQYSQIYYWYALHRKEDYVGPGALLDHVCACKVNAQTAPSRDLCHTVKGPQRMANLPFRCSGLGIIPHVKAVGCRVGITHEWLSDAQLHHTH